MTIVYDGVLLDVTARLAETAIIGAPYRPLLNRRRYRSTGKTQIEPGCWIGEGVHVGEGATIGANSILHGDSRVESDARLGSGVLLTYRSWVDLKARIGDDCVIGGFVCERAVVGRGCRVFGYLIHRQDNPLLGWDDDESEEESPVLEDQVFVGWEARVIGPVVLETRAYVFGADQRRVRAPHVGLPRRPATTTRNWRLVSPRVSCLERQPRRAWRRSLRRR